MPGEGSLRFARRQIPQPYRPVHTSTGEGLSVWAERYAMHIIRMPNEPSVTIPRFGVLLPDYLAPAPGDNRLSIRAERYAMDYAPMMRHKRPFLSPELRIP